MYSGPLMSAAGPLVPPATGLTVQYLRRHLDAITDYTSLCTILSFDSDISPARLLIAPSSVEHTRSSIHPALKATR